MDLPRGMDALGVLCLEGLGVIFDWVISSYSF